MLWTLIQRDRAWKPALLFALAATIAPLLKLGGSAASISGVLLMQGVFMGLVFSQPHRRATLFEVALPICARDLFNARMAALFTLIWAPLLGATATMFLAGWSQANEYGANILLLGLLTSTYLLLLHSVRTKQLAAPGWLAMVLLIAAAAGGVALVVLHHHALIAAICLPLDAVLALRIWQNLPASFQTAPIETSAAAPPARSSDTSIFSPAIRSLFAWNEVGFLPLLVMQRWEESWMLGAFFASFAFAGARRRTAWMRALPISNSGVLAMCFLTIAPFLAVMLIPSPFAETSARQELVRLGGTDRPNQKVQVSLVLYRLAHDGRATAAVAPWGESNTPLIHRVLGVPLYNPYETAVTNSDRFFEWQFARATQTAYGRPIGPRDFTAAREAGLEPVTAQLRIWILMAAAFLITYAAWAWVWELTYWAGWSRLPAAAKKWAPPALGMVMLALFTAFLFWKPLDNGGQLTIELTQGIFFYLAGLMPDNLAAFIVLAASPVALMIVGLELQSRRAELPSKTRPNGWCAWNGSSC